MNMNNPVATSESTSIQSITHYGVSEQLRSEFDMLRELSHTSGHAKYSANTVQMLAQHVVCRNYGSLCYELAHLNWAILHAGNQSAQRNKLLDFYWISTCNSSSKLLAYFAHCAGPRENGLPTIVVLNEAKIEVDISAIKLSIYGHAFTLNGSRANLLSCLMEWLMIVMPNLLETITDSLEGKGLNAIQDLSSSMQKHIYAYLSEHLPPAKLQQRFRSLSQWYQENESSRVSDEGILRFWQQHNKQEGYAKFNQVLKDTLGFMQARDIAHTQTNLNYAVSTKNDAGDVDEFRDNHADLSEQAEMDKHSNSHHAYLISTHPNIEIQHLLQSPKALNKQQVELIHTVIEFPEHSMQLMVSYLRTQTFAKVQHKLIQARRNMTIKTDTVDHILTSNMLTYQDVLRHCVLLQASNQQSLLAIAQILLTQKYYPEACLILLKVSQQMPSLQHCSQIFANLLDCYSEQDKPLKASVMAQWQLQQPAFTELVEQSKVALKHINRYGFTSSTLLAPEVYVNCAETLFDINALLKRLVAKIAGKKLSNQSNFEADRFIFSNEFSKLYLVDTQQDIESEGLPKCSHQQSDKGT